MVNKTTKTLVATASATALALGMAGPAFATSNNTVVTVDSLGWTWSVEATVNETYLDLGHVADCGTGGPVSTVGPVPICSFEADWGHYYLIDFGPYGVTSSNGFMYETRSASVTLENPHVGRMFFFGEKDGNPDGAIGIDRSINKFDGFYEWKFSLNRDDVERLTVEENKRLERLAVLDDISADDCTIVGTPGDDILIGTDGDDVICGLGGDDTIYAGDGDDVVKGGPGDDTIDGGDGDDVLGGGAGDDRIDGGSGDDAMHGATGEDILVGGEGDDLTDGGAGEDALLPNVVGRGQGIESLMSVQPRGWAEDALVDVIDNVDDLASTDALGNFVEDGNGDEVTVLGSVGAQACVTDEIFGEVCFDA